MTVVPEMTVTQAMEIAQREPTTHRPYQALGIVGRYCIADGEPWPCLHERGARCHCGRPVPASSECGCCCANHDDPIPARLDERYDPSPEPIDRSIQ